MARAGLNGTRLVPGLTAAVTLAVILWPLDVSVDHLGSLGDRLQLIPDSVGLVLDSLRNLAAFVPLGFAMALWSGLGATGVALTGAALSACAELIQAFQDERFVSSADVVFNGVGALSGYALARGARRALPSLVRAGKRTRWAVLGATAGISLSGVGLVTGGLDPAGWDPGYVLSKNSSALGRVPWCGKLVSLEIAVGDLTWADPDFQWIPNTMARGPCRGSSWWVTESPEASLAQVVHTRGRIRLRLTAVPHLDQAGPARILTFADTRDGRRRNLLIAQQRDSLVVYIRRRLGGEEGRRPYYVLPGVFQAGSPTEITVDVDQERTIIEGNGVRLLHAHVIGRDWPYLLQGITRYVPAPRLREPAFGLAVMILPMIVSGIFLASVALIPALVGLAGVAALVLLSVAALAGGSSGVAAGALPGVLVGLGFRAVVRRSESPTELGAAPTAETVSRRAEPA